MRITFLDRALTRAHGFVFVAGLVGLLLAACSDKSSSGGDTTGGGETGGSAGDQGTGTGGDANPGTGGQATAGSTGAGGSKATGGSAGTGGGNAGGAGMDILDAGPRMGPLKIMALGDSTTEYTCYRAELAKLLDKTHPKDYQYVGTRNDDFGGCGGYTYDKHNQGMSAYLVSSTTGAMNTHAEAPTWAALKPDVVLLHFATNDCWNGFGPTKILPAYTYIVGEFRKQNPRVTFLVAQLIPLDPMGADGGKTCSSCPVTVKALNAAIPDWATMNSTASSRIVVVDQWTGYVPETDNCAPSRCDGVHPGPTGSVKMGAKWDEALEPLF
jgi:hypothetical protein